MNRKHKVLILSLISIGLIYFFGLARPIFNFFATVIYRLQYFKLGITEQKEEAEIIQVCLLEDTTALGQ